MTMGGQSIAFFLLAVLAVLLCLPLFSEILQLILPPVRRSTGAIHDDNEKNPRLLFLIPAHDEELHTAACVNSVFAIEYPHDRFDVVLIADNCSDATAIIAEQCGATVLKRSDPENPGKPAALAWAISQLPIDAYEACVVLDADSILDSGFASSLSDSRPLRSKSVQTYFGLQNEWETWLTRLSGVLGRIRYEVSYPRKRRANLNCPLTGNGMVIGSDLLSDDGWQAFSLTENWELFANYTVDGTIIDLNARARLYSEEAGSTSQGRTQRTRWMAGRWSVFRNSWRGLLLSNRIGFRQKLDALCELGRPSPALHLALVTSILVMSFTILESPFRWIIVVVALCSLLPEVEGVIRVLVGHPKRGTIIVDFARLPGYVIWRVAITFATVLGKSPTTWKKTERRQA